MTRACAELPQTYELVNDPTSDDIVSWGPNGRTFIVWKPPEFARDLLPLHFKHNNFSSFVRQLNTYGFRKVDPDRWEFANEYFMRGREDLLVQIHRRKPSSSDKRAPANEQGLYGEGGSLSFVGPSQRTAALLSRVPRTVPGPFQGTFCFSRSD